MGARRAAATLFVLLTVAVAACHSGSALSDVPRGSAPRAQPPASSAARSEAASTQQPDAPGADWNAPLSFERVLQVPVLSIGLGRAPWAAILSEQPWLYDGKGWAEIPIASRLRRGSTQGERVGVFFGRDDKPRIMGARLETATDAAHAKWRAVYLRWRNGVWQRDPNEIGRLGGGPEAGLYGVVGIEDPELVCKVANACIAKRRTGWQTLPASAELARAWFSNAGVYVLDSSGMMRLEPKGFARLAWDFAGRGKETGFCADGAGMWVSAASQDALYRQENEHWTRHTSPVRSPAALWASAANDVWVVGADGVGHFDGVRWMRVASLSEKLEHVAGRSPNDVWLGGPTGLWHGQRTR